MARPAFRNLRGYSLDPGFSTRLDTASFNEVTYRIPFEDLEPGPIGEYVEIVDFDPASKCWYEPVDLNRVEVASQAGLAPSEGNPQFHQQFVYAVAMKTIWHFERALGRKIVWYPRYARSRAKNAGSRLREEYVGRLRLHPHALRDANAYYDPDKKAVLFGYFAAADQIEGANYPGGLVCTCLSPDIVAHEMTHAILDSIHHRYMEDTNADVAAFHEGFSDIVALLQRFTFLELVEHQLYLSGGRLDRYTVFGELATQFGQALKGNRGALRSMIGEWDAKGKWHKREPDPADYANNIEAHDRGAVLVATVFDAFQRLYTHRTADLFRIASNGTGQLPEGSISRDLVHRLALEARDIAGHLLHICIRALDYCPPHDISFGDYLRALITADLDIAPEDETGYRIALIEAFRARGIFPNRVSTLSVESLAWSPPDLPKVEQKIIHQLAETMKPLIMKLIETVDRKQIYELSREARRQIHKLFNAQAFAGPEWERFLNKLGLTSLPVSKMFGRLAKPIAFYKDGKRNNDYVPKVEVHTVRAALRSGRENRQIEQVLVTLTQSVTADIGLDGETRLMTFRGGSSLIFKLGDLNTIDLVIQKNIRSHARFESQRDYLLGESEAAPASISPYVDDDRPWHLNFNLLHRH
ncbi:hypothetical protein LJR220_002209 [Bradyrhizobium sp. LjRoot220]|uniref:hypothetical protein n=1 Tax=Bradyrhizobium sp. LjRoot220 TaxID=3342284 RepID=UPI003ECF17FA